MAKIPVPVIESVRKLKKNLETEFDVKKTFLFGSFAKGNYTSDSDIDVCVVAANVENNFKAMMTIADYTVECDARIEAIVISEEDFNQEPSFGVTKEVKQYGVEI